MRYLLFKLRYSNETRAATVAKENEKCVQQRTENNEVSCYTYTVIRKRNVIRFFHETKLHTYIVLFLISNPLINNMCV